MKSVASILRFSRADFDGTRASSDFIGCGEIFFAKRFSFAQEFDNGFRQLNACHPGLVYAGTGKHVGAAGAFANAGIAVAGEERLAVPAGLLQGFRAPRAQDSTLQIFPNGGMLNVVLQIAVGGA